MWDDEQFQKAAVVFLGEVRKVQKVKADDCADENVTFWVLESWKGISEDRRAIDVVTSTTGRLADSSRSEDPDRLICIGGCGARVDEAELYVVFAYEQREEDGSTHLVFDCTDIVLPDDPKYPELVSRLEALGKILR